MTMPDDDRECLHCVIGKLVDNWNWFELELIEPLEGMCRIAQVLGDLIGDAPLQHQPPGRGRLGPISLERMVVAILSLDHAPDKISKTFSAVVDLQLCQEIADRSLVHAAR
jgi:hypothetical protein